LNSLFDRIVDGIQHHHFSSAKDWEQFKCELREIIEGEVMPSEEDKWIPTIDYQIFMCPACRKEITLPILLQGNRKIKAIEERLNDLISSRNTIELQIEYLGTALKEI
jgi:hypothetical protein